MILKVWNVDRTKKKVVIAATFEELVSKVKDALCIEEGVKVCLVLESDGTEIESTEVLEHFSSETLLVLTAGETWSTQSACITTPAATPTTPVTPKHEVSSRPATPPPEELNGCNPLLYESPSEVKMCPETPKSSKVTSSSSSPRCLNIDRVELPTFSPMVVMMLERNDLDNGLPSFLREAATFYYYKYPSLRDSSQYQRIGMKLVRRFPCLAHDGAKPWSFITSKLSSRIRQLRIKDNRKSQDSHTDSMDNPTPAKRFRLARPDIGGNALPEEVFEERIQNIREEWHGRRNEATLMCLMNDTRNNRRNWVKGMAMQSIITTFPCLKYGEYVLQDFYTVINRESPISAREKIGDNLTKLLSSVMDVMPKSVQGENVTEVDVIKYMEKSVAIERGKGVKSKPIMKFIEVDDIDIEEEALRRSLQVKPDIPPSLKILTIEDSFKMAYVVGDDCIINCHAKDMKEALLCLVATYYVMDLDYPAMFGQFLGFLQQFVLEEPYTFSKGTNFIKMAHKIASKK